jgi:hypothetical protein
MQVCRSDTDILGVRCNVPVDMASCAVSCAVYKSLGMTQTQFCYRVLSLITLRFSSSSMPKVGFWHYLDTCDTPLQASREMSGPEPTVEYSHLVDCESYAWTP